MGFWLSPSTPKGSKAVAGGVTPCLARDAPLQGADSIWDTGVKGFYLLLIFVEGFLNIQGAF